MGSRVCLADQPTLNATIGIFMLRTKIHTPVTTPNAVGPESPSRERTTIETTYEIFTKKILDAPKSKSS